MFLAYGDEVENYQVTWSADGHTIGFVADREIEGDNRERVLVEADVNTGQTLRTLYSFPYVRRLTTLQAFAWTPALDAVLVGVQGSSGPQPPLLLDLHAGTEIPVDTFVLEHQHLGYVCPQFSPNGTYFAAYLYYDLDEYNPWGFDFGALSRISQLTIFNRQGQFQASLGDPNDPEMLRFGGCPVWLPDEQSFYVRGVQFYEEEIFIFQYYLSTQQLVQRQPISPLVESPLVLS
jgi:hypothetical protein